ncbi:MAG: hypothetical protein EXQ74_05570 [Thermoleophilia bacterium]|nr:hypothetical protein [Thermoleophilia bacterium]
MPVVASAAVVPLDGATVASVPASVRVDVGVPVEGALARGEVRGPRGAHRHGAVVVPADPEAIWVPIPADGSGTYHVVWSGFTVDGNVVSGTTSFAVRTETPVAAGVTPPGTGGSTPWGTLARVLVLVGVLGTAGMAVTREWVVAGAVRGGEIAPPGVDGAMALRTAAGNAAAGPIRRWWRAWWWLLGLWFVGLAVAIAVQGVVIGGEWATLLTDTRWGSAWMGLFGLGAVAGIVAAVVHRFDPLLAPGGWRLPSLALPGALGAIVLAWSGHATSGTDRVAGLIFDSLHSWATAIWLGGLLMLAVLAFPILRHLSDKDRVRLGAGVVVRFSSLAVAAVAVLVVTGIYRALAELPSLSALVSTEYGVVLLVKVGVFGVMVAVAAWNRFVLHPRIERRALGIHGGDDRDSLTALHASARAEVVLGVVVMVAVALLVGLVPPT